MQTIETFAQRWLDLKIGADASTHQRYDAAHPLEIFFGYDVSGDRIFFLITPNHPGHLPTQGESIDLRLFQRGDGLFTIMLRLVRPDQDSVFVHLCWDLAESTRSCNDAATGTATFLGRYRKWQRLLERGEGLLSSSQVKGLIGELLFLQLYLFERYGVGIALKGWLGPSGADQDFRFDDYWYEVKAADPGATSVRISSLEQLDTDRAGQLCVISLERAGSNLQDAISLNTLVSRIRDSILGDAEHIDMFDRRMEETGYIDSREYSEDLFVFRGMRRYLVSDTFPRIRQKMVDPSVVRVMYDLSVEGLSPFEIRQSE